MPSKMSQFVKITPFAVHGGGHGMNIRIWKYLSNNILLEYSQLFTESTTLSLELICFVPFHRSNWNISKALTTTL